MAKEKNNPRLTVYRNVLSLHSFLTGYNSHGGKNVSTTGYYDHMTPSNKNNMLGYVYTFGSSLQRNVRLCTMCNKVSLHFIAAEKPLFFIIVKSALGTSTS